MTPSRLHNSLGASWGVEIRCYMAAVVGACLGIDPADLPPMQDSQLWQSFKTAAASRRRVLQEAPDEVISQLSMGERFALQIGMANDTPHLPEGECGLDLMLSAIPDLSDDETIRVYVYAITMSIALSNFRLWVGSDGTCCLIE